MSSTTDAVNAVIDALQVIVDRLPESVDKTAIVIPPRLLIEEEGGSEGVGTGQLGVAGSNQHEWDAFLSGKGNVGYPEDDEGVFIADTPFYAIIDSIAAISAANNGPGSTTTEWDYTLSKVVYDSDTSEWVDATGDLQGVFGYNTLEYENRDVATGSGTFGNGLTYDEVDPNKLLPIPVGAIVFCSYDPVDESVFFTEPNAVSEDGRIIPVVLTQTGGSDGTTSASASWTYTVKTTNGDELATGRNPASDKFVRPTLGQMVKATFGLAIYDGTTVTLTWVNEVPAIEECT